MNVDDAIEQVLPEIPGWCGPFKGKRMAELSRGASMCIELGVFGGRGLVAMALTLAEQGFGRAHGIDPFTPDAALEGTNDKANDEWWGQLDYESVARAAQITLYQLKLTHCAQIIRMRSRDVACFYEDGSIDVLHQDSNHSEEVSTEEVELWTPKIAPGGYWIFDDTNWSSTHRAQRMLEDRGFSQIEDYESWKVYRRLE